ncbi:hypothetical protein U2436_28320, partial [Klebsiella pneumoniae]
KRAYCLKTQPATGETYPKSDLFNKAAWYVKNWSMWNDIAILFKTVGVVLKRDGAY